MVMFEQSRRLSEPLRWGRREKTAVAVLLGCLLLAVIGLGAYALTSGSRGRGDCVDVTFASTLGGAQLHACGTQAARICASGSFRGIKQELQAACRRADLPFRAPG
jgi:hypothetical protein